jgi:hypothetical protein
MTTRSRTLAAALLAVLPLAALAAEGGADAAKSYRLETEGTTRALRSGAAGKLVLAIVPLNGTHVHPEAPLKIALTASGGLALAKSALGHADAADPRSEGPRFEVPFTATQAGPQEARARVDFYICSDKWCVKQTREVAVAIDVK